MLSVVSGLFGLLAVVNCNVIVYTQITPHVIEDQFLDVPAGFGPELPVEGLRGLLVVGEPADGCGNLTAPPDVDNFTKNWIVLVARYNCSFEVKVRNAMAAGYGCAIVHNVNSSELETMFAKNPEGIDIPSVFVGDLAGLLLAQKYTYDKGYYIMVNDDVPFNINTQLLLPFGMVVVVCLVIILIFAIVKCIKDRRRARRNRLPNRSLKKIPTCKFSKGDPYETCAICLDDYQEGERLRVLPCAHAYHAKCVDPWLTQNRRVCPVCKRTVLMAGEREARPRDSDDSDDTEPLLAAAAPRTQGGTFDAPRVNPLTRPSFLERLRRARPRPLQATSPTEESEQAGDGNEEGRSEDTSPLLAPASAAAVSELRPRRMRRGRRTRSAPRHAPPPAPAAAAAPAPAAPAPAPAPTMPSINNTERGEIGVAALPAPAAQDPAAPHHVDL